MSGSGMAIIHIGQSHICTPERDLLLKNVCRGSKRQPMEPSAPLWFGKGEGRVAQRDEDVEQQGSNDTGSFYPGLGRRKA